MLDRKSEIVDFELTLPSDQRGPRTLLLSARVIPSIDDQPDSILLAIEDITDRKHAEQELKSLNATLEDRVLPAYERGRIACCGAGPIRASPARKRSPACAIVTTAADAIITIDEHGSIESCNPATERMFDYPASAMLGQKIEMLILWS